jgi:hypothetical protein
MPKVSLRAVGPTGRRLKCLKLKNQEHKTKKGKVPKFKEDKKTGDSIRNDGKQQERKSNHESAKFGKHEGKREGRIETYKLTTKTPQWNTKHNGIPPR